MCDNTLIIRIFLSLYTRSLRIINAGYGSLFTESG